MEQVYILGGLRSAFGSFGGTLKDLSAVDLGVEVSKATLQKTGVDPSLIEESIFGNVIPTGKDGIYLARHIGLKAGVPIASPALTLNRLCGSGMEAVIQAAKKIMLGEAHTVLAGGVESMSNAPYVVRNARFGVRYGNTEFEDSLATGLTDVYVELPMGMTAENLSDQYKISREEQDLWAATSQERAEEATNKGILKDEIHAITISGKNPIVFDKDEFIKGKAGATKLATLKPAFKKDGTVTAGNASGINDGAAALIVASASQAKKLGKEPLAIVKSWGHAGCEPAKMGIGPAVAIPAALQKAGLSLKDIGLFEINEAFAAQYLAVQKELGLDPKITNVNGGAVAIGHPLGASGSRVTLTLALEMQRRGVKYGVASLCIGGGQGIAIVLENPKA
ncbi:acetyl-CoA C-acetyltransferase [Leptospira kanakyensis]|uniref:Acetyl-CoA C-acetyltransferase n=1 Tax=Leptospira kanakyensis TaxID=2484968 RepID=A0A6N4QEB2_9LEPT|nr:acetyl-CoA C-acetyltransferase [Leptospira kanakyensis]MCW7469508.1 acetyl-CoA C-acetyltransferase [Leptospira kanakyensis]MCW7480496.1 acetyl-CoA C-acetyltransferase [Leptospira kanakyensis]TGK50680.1 acetyl-CoA C-acetyltransferase [Leptospira kanakyensis]TGK63719.1 acetyl-CoA C-acetyltransferase [Leptospira kanakyensis]TGK69818.1 acetyl-CoA C-acetyltransferase [Leptospira kanakyensis]